MLEQAPQSTSCISPRERRGSQGHRAGEAWKMAPRVVRVAGNPSAACTRVSTRPNIVFWTERNHEQGFKDIKLLTSDSQTQVYIRCCCGLNRVQFYFIVNEAPRTPSDWLRGSVLSLLLLSYTHVIHTSISDHMHQVVAGSGGNTIELALLSTWINDEYIKVSVALKHSTKALNTTSNSVKILPRTPHIPKLLPPTNCCCTQDPKAIDIGWSNPHITTKCKLT